MTEVGWDPRVEGVLVCETDDYAVHVMPMIFNDRVTITGKLTDGTLAHGYDHGWCFDKGLLAIRAALDWDPETQDEPAGYKKRATPGQRKAPHG